MRLFSTSLVGPKPISNPTFLVGTLSVPSGGPSLNVGPESLNVLVSFISTSVQSVFLVDPGLVRLSHGSGVQGGRRL